MSQVKVVIMAGGQGSRFWPISRLRHPKQFLSISSSGESLIQATARRVEPLAGRENIVIVTNILHKELVNEHVPWSRVITEPVGRNTAASIGLAAVLDPSGDPDDVMVVLPADHTVSEEEKLLETLREAIEVARTEELLVTVGIRPTWPNTAYGYICRGSALDKNAYMVGRFYEKPNEQRAKEYLEAGDFFWNSGMFIWRRGVFLQAVREFMPELDEALRKIQTAEPAEQESVVEECFADLKSVSVDFGILEHAKNCAVVAARPYGWNDVGAWDAWAEHFEPDPDGNLLHGDSMALQSKNCLVYSKDRFIALVGAEDLVVIDAGDAVMVCPRDRVQEVRKIVDELKQQGRDDLT